MEDSILKRRNFLSVIHRISPYPRNFPNMNLTIGDDVGSRGSEMSANSFSDAIDSLPDVHWNFV
jgi:hypothetical protein